MTRTVADILISKAHEIASLHYRIELQIAQIIRLGHEIEDLKAGNDQRIADLQAEIGRISRAFHDYRNPHKPYDATTADAMRRLSEDYHRYRKQGGFPYGR